MAEEQLKSSFDNASFNVELAVMDDDDIVVLNSPIQFNQGNITQAIGQPTVHEHYIVTNETDYVNRFLKSVSNSGDALLLARMGMVAGARKRFSEWQTFRLLGYSATPFVEGSDIMLRFADGLSVMDRVAKTRAHSGKMSAIVKAICDEYGFSSIIEETSGSKDASYIQSFQTDFDFITSRVVPRSVNAKGQGGYQFYIIDDIVHFHTVAYKAELKSIRYFNPGPSSRLVISDESQERIEDGAGGVKLITSDCYTGESRDVDSKQDKLINFANATPDFKDRSFDMEVPYHVGGNRHDEAVAMAQALYAESYINMFSSQLTLTNLPFISIGDILNLELKQTKSTSPWSGLFSVRSVVHDYVKGEVKSTYLISRGELLTRNLETRAVYDELSLDTQLSETFATGQLLNMQEVAGSSQTAGDFRTSSGQIVKTVEDV